MVDELREELFAELTAAVDPAELELAVLETADCALDTTVDTFDFFLRRRRRRFGGMESMICAHEGIRRTAYRTPHMTAQPRGVHMPQMRVPPVGVWPAVV